MALDPTDKVLLYFHSLYPRIARERPLALAPGNTSTCLRSSSADKLLYRYNGNESHRFGDVRDRAPANRTQGMYLSLSQQGAAEDLTSDVCDVNEEHYCFSMVLTLHRRSSVLQFGFFLWAKRRI